MLTNVGCGGILNKSKPGAAVFWGTLVAPYDWLCWNCKFWEEKPVVMLLKVFSALGNSVGGVIAIFENAASKI